MEFDKRCTQNKIRKLGFNIYVFLKFPGGVNPQKPPGYAPEQNPIIYVIIVKHFN